MYDISIYCSVKALIKILKRTVKMKKINIIIISICNGTFKAIVLIFMLFLLQLWNSIFMYVKVDLTDLKTEKEQILLPPKKRMKTRLGPPVF